jgi:hypothetical protein
VRAANAIRSAKHIEAQLELRTRFDRAVARVSADVGAIEQFVYEIGPPVCEGLTTQLSELAARTIGAGALAGKSAARTNAGNVSGATGASGCAAASPLSTHSPLPPSRASAPALPSSRNESRLLHKD